jgi:hypothetical protein
MEHDATKVDGVVLALLHLNAHTDHGITRAWKGFDGDAMDRLQATAAPRRSARAVMRMIWRQASR